MVQLEGDRATTAIWKLEIFRGQASWKARELQLQSGNSSFFGRSSWKDRATTAICELEIFGWQALLENDKEPPLQSENFSFLLGWLVVRRLCYNDKYRVGILFTRYRQ